MTDRGEPFLDVLDAELAEARRRLATIVDRLDALGELHRRATVIQARLQHRHVEFADLELDASRKGEEGRARLASLCRRIAEEGETDGTVFDPPRP